jgi:hypothetical protein
LEREMEAGKLGKEGWPFTSMKENTHRFIIEEISNIGNGKKKFFS